MPPLQDLGLKLSVLFRKHLYSVAAGLAENAAGTDPGAGATVHKEWGDHLYDKGDREGAMRQYLLTIGTVQPSHVIRRYLEASQVYILAEYLQALHEAPGDLAGEGHTTLMLNCFTRMKEKSRYAMTCVQLAPRCAALCCTVRTRAADALPICP